MWHYTRSENINAPTNDQPLGPRPLAPNLNILQWQDSGRGYGNVIFMGVNNQSLKHIQFFLGSVRVHIIDDTNDDPNFTPQRTGSNIGEYAIRNGNPLWNVFGNTTVKLPWTLQLSGNFNASGGSPYNITTGFDNNGDGNFNDRPFYSPTGTPVCSATSADRVVNVAFWLRQRYSGFRGMRTVCSLAQKSRAASGDAVGQSLIDRGFYSTLRSTLGKPAHSHAVRSTSARRRQRSRPYTA
jgi:hypothetical protein